MIWSARPRIDGGIVSPERRLEVDHQLELGRLPAPRRRGRPEPARHTPIAVPAGAHPRSDQPGIGGLEAPEGPADRAHQIDVLIIGAAEGEIGCCRVIVWYRHKTENDAARVDLIGCHPACQRLVTVSMDPGRVTGAAAGAGQAEAGDPQPGRAERSGSRQSRPSASCPARPSGSPAP
jgi:hypothetical protein